MQRGEGSPRVVVNMDESATNAYLLRKAIVFLPVVSGGTSYLSVECTIVAGRRQAVMYGVLLCFSSVSVCPLAFDSPKNLRI